jgi:uncharacterized protein YjbI with pentapeptide repeats
MTRPKFIDDDVFRCLRAGELDRFHHLIERRDVVDFSDADLRGTDVRKADIAKVVLRGAYLKDADLRGLDLRKHDLEGCSLHNAKIGGAYFPSNVSAAEIEMSVRHGTRLRMN